MHLKECLIVLEKVLKESQSRNKDYSMLLEPDEEVALTHAITVCRESEALSDAFEQVCIERDMLKKKYERLKNENMDLLERLEVGLEVNFQQGRKLEIERYEPIVSRLKNELNLDLYPYSHGCEKHDYHWQDDRKDVGSSGCYACLQEELSKQSHSAQFRRVELQQAKIGELEAELKTAWLIAHAEAVKVDELQKKYDTIKEQLTGSRAEKSFLLTKLTALKKKCQDVDAIQKVLDDYDIELCGAYGENNPQRAIEISKMLTEQPT